VATDRILGINLVHEGQESVWSIELQLDAGRRAEVVVDPRARSVVSYAIRSEPDDAGP
jgi:hypothetical protein